MKGHRDVKEDRVLEGLGRDEVGGGRIHVAHGEGVHVVPPHEPSPKGALDARAFGLAEEGHKEAHGKQDACAPAQGVVLPQMHLVEQRLGKGDGGMEDAISPGRWLFGQP